MIHTSGNHVVRARQPTRAPIATRPSISNDDLDEHTTWNVHIVIDIKQSYQGVLPNIDDLGSSRVIAGSSDTTVENTCLLAVKSAFMVATSGEMWLSVFHTQAMRIPKMLSHAGTILPNYF